MKLVFFGNSKYSVIGAEIIHSKFPLTLIVSNPNSPVSSFARLNKIELLETDTLSNTVVEKIAQYDPDFLIVEDYGLILPKKLLKLPKKAPLNIHHSLLPKFRGPTPAPSLILAGENVSGASVIKMAETVDSGDILSQKQYVLKPGETTDSLLKVLNKLGGEIILKVLENYSSITPQKQNESLATYSLKMNKEDGHINLKSPPNKNKLNRMINAYYPWPGVWFTATPNGKEVRIKLLPEQKLQIESKKPMSYKDFINGYKQGEEILKKLNLT